MSNFIIGFILRLVAVVGAVALYTFIVHNVFNADVTTLTRLLAIPVGWFALKTFNYFWSVRRQ